MGWLSIPGVHYGMACFELGTRRITQEVKYMLQPYSLLIYPPNIDCLLGQEEKLLRGRA